MELDRPLSRGAVGGHEPIKYLVEDYLSGQFIKVRFTSPKGFNGFHSYEIVKNAKRPVVLRHTIEMNTHGAALLTWPFFIRPLHDALLEDSLATAQASLGAVPQMQAWTLWVRFLRWILSGGKARSQFAPSKELQRTR